VGARRAALVSKDTEVLTGLEMSGLAAATASGRHTGLACAVVPKIPKANGTRQLAKRRRGRASSGPDRRRRRRVGRPGSDLSQAAAPSGGTCRPCSVSSTGRKVGKDALAAERMALHSLFTRGDTRVMLTRTCSMVGLSSWSKSVVTGELVPQAPIGPLASLAPGQFDMFEQSQRPTVTWPGGGGQNRPGC